MRLSDVQHQPVAQRRLQQAFASGRIPHAFLFAGPDGVGKQMLAARFARLLLCEKPAKIEPIADEKRRTKDDFQWKDACGRCEDCVLMASGNHPDFRLIHRGLAKFHPERRIQKSRSAELVIDVIRHFLLAQIGQRPARGRAKVFVISEAERLNPESQNAMLKTLEEPPGDSYLILIARSADRMLPTIRSRCQAITFRALPTDFVTERLAAAHNVPTADARYLAELSEGRLGVAIKFAAQGLAKQRLRACEILQAIGRDPLALNKAIKELAEAIPNARADDEPETTDAESTRSGIRTALAMLSGALRDALRVASGAPPAAHVGAGERKPLEALASAWGRRGLIRAVRAIAAAESEIDLNANVALAIDGLGIELSRGLIATAV